MKNSLLNALKEDIGDGDHSTRSCIDANAKGKAILKIKEKGILAGVDIAEKIFSFIEPQSVIKKYKKDGEEMQYGEIAFEVSAKIWTYTFMRKIST